MGGVRIAKMEFRARVREADLERKKNKEAKEPKRKLNFVDRDAKKPKQDQSQRSGGTQVKTPFKKCHKTHLGDTSQMNVKPEGTIIVNSIPAHVLYDLGASVSFVPSEICKNLTTPPNKLPFHLEVKIAGNEIVVVSKVYRDVEIKIDDSVFKINLIPIVLGAFDIVIGMDWLDSSPWGVLILFVKKKDGSMRMCIDYRKLNKVTVKNVYPLLRIDDLFDQLQGARWFLKIDLRSSYHQLKAREEDIPKKTIFSFIPKARRNMKLTYEKSWKPYEMTDCIEVDAAKIKAVMNWQTPKDVGEIQSFLGLVSYYQRFIQDFSKIASSLTKLTKKNTPFVWGEEQEEVFVTLRRRLCETPILVLPKGTEYMVVYSDASYSGLGCVLIQRGKFIAYASRQLKKHEENYPTHVLEFSGVIVDGLTKNAHFIPIREDMLVHKLAKIYVNEIVTRHEVLLSIVSDRDGRFTSNFGRDFQEDLGTRLHMSTTFHPQTDGQSELIIQTMGGMLRACIIDFRGNWDDHLPLVEFDYNNSYHASIKMPHYEMIYGRKCKTPVCWDEVRSRELASTDLVLATTEKIETIR
nr:hypothetical protein [Tanacetum cinerariifolium]